MTFGDSIDRSHATAGVNLAWAKGGLCLLALLLRAAAGGYGTNLDAIDATPSLGLHLLAGVRGSRHQHKRTLVPTRRRRRPCG